MSLKNGDRSLKNVSKGVLLELSILKKKKIFLEMKSLVFPTLCNFNT